ncbi:MAG: isoaspartyl peptidase/L-asparaginase [Bacteroidota bacterium]
MNAKIIVHGGAWDIPDAYVANHIQGVHAAITQVYPLLVKGLSALDAVEAAVNILEADPTFDAGRGAFLNNSGQIELDALIMDGQDLSFGAVAALSNQLHPVSIARKVMEETDHCFLVGAGANAFAKAMGFEELAPSELLTERELAFYHQIRQNPDYHARQSFEAGPYDTVGAVAMDINGRLAAATSTGGTPRKLPGRVGDSPIAGAGAYADGDLGACSTTGWGEAIMKVLLSKRVCDAFAHLPAMQAAQEGIQQLKQKVDGLGGIIGIDKKGNYAFAHNTPRMAFAYYDPDKGVCSAIKVD